MIGEEDLEQLIGAAKVDQYGTDDGTAERNDGIIEECCSQAEDLCSSYLLKGWSREQIRQLIDNDKGLRVQVAWVACELLSERRTEFLNAEGHGAYWTQYERAIEYFDRLAKAKGHSVGEVTAGQSALRGGTVNPRKQAGEPTFVFAVSKNNPNGSGGF